MTEENRTLFDRLFGSLRGESGLSQREEKVLRYIVYRLNQDADLRQVVEEEYVRRNADSAEMDEILCNPELVQAAREHLEEVFGSGELDPRQAAHIGGSPHGKQEGL